MRLAAKWQGSWRWMGGFDLGDGTMPGPGGSVDVSESVVASPWWSCRGWRGAGNWSGRWPSVARHFEVFLPRLRGDHGDWSNWVRALGEVGDIGICRRTSNLTTISDFGEPTILGFRMVVRSALELAAHHSECLGGLIIYGAEARFHRTLRLAIARRVLERFPLPSDNRFVNQFFHLLYGTKPEPGPLVDFVVERIWETDQSVIAERLAQLESFDVTERLGGWILQHWSSPARDVIVPVARQALGAGTSRGPDSKRSRMPANRIPDPSAKSSGASAATCDRSRRPSDGEHRAVDLEISIIVLGSGTDEGHILTRSVSEGKRPQDLSLTLRVIV